jgi:class 3 adenylate cyclase
MNQTSPTAEPSAPDVERLLREAEPEPPQRTGRVTCSVAFFDLEGSTARKLELGHRAGVMAAVKHNRFCGLVVDHYGGEVLKELGDGIMAIFNDPLDAVLAAETARSGLATTELSTKVGLTTGLVDLVQTDGGRDVLGAVVDRAARIQAAALPDQVLIDRTQVDAISDYLGDHPEIWLGQSSQVSLRGVGDVELWPVESSATEAAQPRLPERLRVYGTGRLPIADKLRFMNYAESEVIEFGTGLTTFASYFTNLSPAVWKGPVMDMLGRGVALRCYALDPDSDLARNYYELRGEPMYADESRSALTQLRAIRDELNSAFPAEKMELFTYRSLPSYYVLAVDPGSERSGMHFSPYLPRLRRAECPVFEVSRSAEPDLFGQLQRSLEAQLAAATPVE